MSRLSANMLLLIAGMLWGGGFVAQETAMEDIGPFTFMVLRFSIAALAILPFVWFEMRQRDSGPVISKSEFLPLLNVGFMFFMAMAFQQVGLLGTTVTNAGVLTGLYVVLTPIIALLALRQPQPLLVWPAALLAFLGIWFLGGGGLDRLTWGDWLIVISAVFAALHVLAMGHASKTLRRPATVATAQFLVSTALSLVCLGVAKSVGWQHEPTLSVATVVRAAPEILYAAIVAGAIAFTIMAVCQQYTRSADAAVLMSSEALFAALAGALILDERLSWLGYLGAGLLFAAILITSIVSAKFEDSSTGRK